MNSSTLRWSSRLVAALSVLCSWVVAASAQLTFTPDRSDGMYEAGATIGWTVQAEPGARAAGEYGYTVRMDGGTEIDSGTFELRDGRARIETALTAPGMAIVEVRPPDPDQSFGSRSTGGPGRIMLAAAVDPANIVPAELPPADFDEFWASQIARLEEIPMNPTITAGESDRPGVQWGTLRLNNINDAGVHAQYAKPAGEGPFPALLIFQYASPPYPLEKSWATEHAENGWLVLNVQPHDVPPDMPQEFYDNLPALIRNYRVIGQHSREESHFLQMYLGAYRAVEYVASRPDWDGETLAVMGTSMGGQQSFAVAGLNPRVTDLVVHVPAGADVTGPLHGRAASYPNWNLERPEVLETARYFDTAYFAPRITARSLVSMGFIDDISTPTGIWAVFNQIQGPKELVPLVDAHHNHIATEEQQVPYTTRAAEWLAALVRGMDPLGAGTPR